MLIVADDRRAAAERLERVLAKYQASGFKRRADASYEEAIQCAKENGLNLPMVLK